MTETKTKTKTPNTQKIRELNDQFRTSLSPAFGRVHFTRGVGELDNLKIKVLFSAVANFNEFASDNDPYGEHDFGKIVFDGEDYFWKIDYYGKDLMSGSEDPSNPDVTTRVLTVMRADEY